MIAIKHAHINGTFPNVGHSGRRALLLKAELTIRFAGHFDAKCSFHNLNHKTV